MGKGRYTRKPKNEQERETGVSVRRRVVHGVGSHNGKPACAHGPDGFIVRDERARNIQRKRTQERKQGRLPRWVRVIAEHEQTPVREVYIQCVCGARLSISVGANVTDEEGSKIALSHGWFVDIVGKRKTKCPDCIEKEQSITP